MGHFKRYRSKDRRAGCLLCKPHKSCKLKDSWGSLPQQEKRAILRELEQKAEVEFGRGVDREDLD